MTTIKEKNMLKKLTTLAVCLSSMALMAKPSSQYTSVAEKDCITTENSAWNADAEIDFYAAKCPSFGGYEVEVSGGDLRYNLKLSYNGKAIETEQLGAFHDMGSSKIEWRYDVGSKGDIKYTALIYRLNFQDWSEEKEENFEESRLIVVRLEGEKSCIIGRVDATDYKDSNKPNIVATQIADDSKLVCK
jgi:hypothetical protein